MTIGVKQHIAKWCLAQVCLKHKCMCGPPQILPLYYIFMSYIMVKIDYITPFSGRLVEVLFPIFHSCDFILQCFQVLEKMINNGHFNSHISLFLHLKSAKLNKCQISSFVLVTLAFSMCVKRQQAKGHLISKCVESNNQGNIHSRDSLLWNYEMTERNINKGTY